MGGAPSARIALSEMETGGVLLANMLEAWLDSEPNVLASMETIDELQDHRAASEQTRLCVCAPIDDGASSSPPREHRASVCSLPESTGAGLERSSDPHPGPGSWLVGSADDGTGGLQDLGERYLAGPSGCGVCLGSLTPGAFRPGLASAVAVVCLDPDLGHRRGWLLRSQRFQRRPSFGIERHNGPGRTSFSARAPPGRQAQQARKGELRFPLPVGYCYDEQAGIIPDPDEEVRGAVELVFRLFRETGSAYTVVQRFFENGLRFPKRAYGGAWDGQLLWGRLSHGRVLSILKNPCYAGMYVFGRYQYRQQITAAGEVRKRMQAVARREWRVSIKEHHEGYIRWEEYEKNAERLEKNRTNGEETVLGGPAREGLALLQGMLLCGSCGRSLTVRYLGNDGIYPTYLCNRLVREGLASNYCMSFRCDLVDAAISQEVLKALQPAELKLALAALHELEVRDQTIFRQWQMRLERAEYEAALAERRYQEVDPSQRLVAATLERRWNEALLRLEDLKKQAVEFQHQETRLATPEQKAKVLALARDLPCLWHASSTRAKDRKSQ